MKSVLTKDQLRLLFDKNVSSNSDDANKNETFCIESLYEYHCQSLKNLRQKWDEKVKFTENKQRESDNNNNNNNTNDNENNKDVVSTPIKNKNKNKNTNGLPSDDVRGILSPGGGSGNENLDACDNFEIGKELIEFLPRLRMYIDLLKEKEAPEMTLLKFQPKSSGVSPIIINKNNTNNKADTHGDALYKIENYKQFVRILNEGQYSSNGESLSSLLLSLMERPTKYPPLIKVSIYNIET